jgi:hypothetical protein
MVVEVDTGDQGSVALAAGGVCNACHKMSCVGSVPQVFHSSLKEQLRGPNEFGQRTRAECRLRQDQLHKIFIVKDTQVVNWFAAQSCQPFCRYQRSRRGVYLHGDLVLLLGRLAKHHALAGLAWRSCCCYIWVV